MRLSRSLPFLLATSILAPFVGSGVAVAAPVVADGPRVHVDCDVPEQRTADKAKAVIEATLALAESRLPYRLPAGQKILVHLFVTGQAFADASRVAGDADTTDLSTTGEKSRESRVLVTPRAEAGYLLLVDDLPELTRYHLAFQTVVQMLRRAEAPSLSFWPAWYAEGLADRIALDAIATPGGPPPMAASDMVASVREAALTGRLLPVSRLLVTGTVAVQFVRRIQAQWIALHRVLEAEPEKLTRLHEAIRNLPVAPPPAEGERDHRSLAVSRACARLLGEIYGPPESLDPKLSAYALAATAPWFDVLRWSQFQGDELVCGAPTGSTAVAISETPPPGGPFSVSCEMRLSDLGVQQAEIYLGYERREDPRFAKLALRTDGFVTLLVFADGIWQERLRMNQKVDLSTFPVGAWIPVRVVCDGTVLRLDVRGAKLFEVAAPEGFDLLRGRIGFGAFSEVVRFRKITVAPYVAEPPAANPAGKPADGR